MDYLKTTRLLKEDMLRFLREAPVVIPEEGTIAGFTLFDPKEVRPPELPRDMHLYDNLHFSMGTTFLTYGFAGVAERAGQAVRPDMPEERSASLTAICEVYQAICRFIERHAQEAGRQMETAEGQRRERLEGMREDLTVLSAGRPRTFHQAVQAYYFAWKLRGILNTSTMGRLDQYLYPFYAADIENGTETPESALALICELWELVNQSGSGDTLMNVMLGGQTPEGEDLTNDLSVLMLKATGRVAKAEPHVNYRYHKGMREDFLEEAARVQLLGIAQATMYNDEVLIPALLAAGIPQEYAYDYTNDGCTEIIIDQKSTIFFDKFDIVKCFELAFFNGNPPPLPGEAKVGYWNRYLPAGEWTTTLETGFASGDMAGAKTFEECLEAFRRQFRYQMMRSLTNLIENYKKICSEDVAPALLNGSFEETLSTGMDCHRDGLPVQCINMFAGSIPTVADCLAAIRETVFEKKLFTIAELQQAVAADFEGYEPMRRQLLAAPKFGNDIDSVDLLAADIAELFCDLVKEAGDAHGVVVWPSLLGYLFVQESYFTGATPDGRHWKDPIAEHYSPTPGRAVNGPTAVMCSCGKGPLKRAFGTAPVQISLSRSVVARDEQGLAVVRALTEAAVKKDFVMLNIGIYDVDVLREARKHPEQYEDIIVRVWGYSARFIDLSDEMQRHVIARVIANG